MKTSFRRHKPYRLLPPYLYGVYATAVGTSTYFSRRQGASPFPFGAEEANLAANPAVGGEGDVAFRFLESLNSASCTAVQDVLQDNLQEETQIYVYDINPNMLNVGKKRAQERGLEDLQSLVWVVGDAEALCFEDASMDGYTIAFGIRNVTHIEKVLAEAYRDMLPSHPQNS